MPRPSNLTDLLVLIAALCLFTRPTVAQEQARSPQSSTCHERMVALSERASVLATKAQEHNRFALDHAEKYKLEFQTCELAKKANTRPQLDACLSLLDRAEQRAQRGNKAAEAIAKESAALQAESSAHNKTCPSNRVQVVQQ
jgi:hypothetical protein